MLVWYTHTRNRPSTAFGNAVIHLVIRRYLK